MTIASVALSTDNSAEQPIIVKSDGSPWPFVLLHGEQMTGADTRTECVAALIPGYADLPDNRQGHDKALEFRFDQALSTASMLQSGFVAHAVEAGQFDPDTAGEDVLTALFIERTVPFAGIPNAAGEVNTEWTADVPLVLVDTDYAPFTTLEKPTGAVVFIQPYTETTYLDSLAQIGLIRLLVSTTV